MRITTSSFFACILFASFILRSLSSSSQQHQQDDGGVADDEILQQMDVMLEWLDDEDGSIDPRLEIRRSNPNDPTSRIGIFVKKDEMIQANELLMEIPEEVVIQLDNNMVVPNSANTEDDDSEDEDDEEEVNNKIIINEEEYRERICDLAWAIRDEFDDGEESDYYPYLKFLQLQQPYIQVPAMYSPAATHVFLQIAIWLLNGFNNLNEIALWPWTFYEESCIYDGGNDDKGNSLSPYFITLAVQRGILLLEHNALFIPFYDLIMHHSDPSKTNIVTKSSILLLDNKEEGLLLEVHALRDLQPGEELLRSYRHCDNNDCHYNTEREDLGTPEILRDYGFIEPYPHTFHFLDDITVIVQDLGDGNYAATCEDDECPSKEDIEGLIDDLKQTEYMIQASENIMKKSEYETIKAYHKALEVVLTTVLPHCQSSDEEEEAELEEEEDEEEDEQASDDAEPDDKRDEL